MTIMQAWSWLAANAFAVLVVVYLASTLCMLALALHAHWLATRIGKISREAGRLSVLVDNLMKAENARAEALDALNKQLETARTQGPSAVPDALPEVDRARLRNELELLIAEMSTEDGREQPQPSSVEA